MLFRDRDGEVVDVRGRHSCWLFEK
jgi:hypothetical protein